jgi:N-acetylglucosaminyl-diphospho-decaprenol L-rhamnosyltransferase
MEHHVHRSDKAAHSIYVVVPVFNRKSYTERFLHCLRKQTFRNFKVIVVDDGSTDGTPELITEGFREVQLLRGDGNLWWTGAINLGIRHAMSQASETDAVLVINDDLEVDPDYLDILYALWKSTPKTLIGSVVVDIESHDTIDNGGVIINWWTAKYRTLNHKRRLSGFEKNYSIDVSYLTGRGVLIPIQVFYKIGLYDDKHFQQCGDTELTVRAKNAGYRLLVSYAAVVKSHVESSNNINVSNHYFLKDLRAYFFGVKSNYRLKYLFFFSFNSATGPFQFISFLICHLLRIIYHFISRLRLK